MNDPLTLFLPPVREWFRRTLGEPTPVQAQGWPVIAAGENTLLLAPTGSGKTLAAFLACLDGLWRQRDSRGVARRDEPPHPDPLPLSTGGEGTRGSPRFSSHESRAAGVPSPPGTPGGEGRGEGGHHAARQENASAGREETISPHDDEPPHPNPLPLSTGGEGTDSRLRTHRERGVAAHRHVHVLYISPLKALNNDIYRNLQLPLEGVQEAARSQGLTLPKIDVAVRTGDTPAAERQRLLRRPPHVLITTPESLHLLLTSRARETLRGVTHCIVDEIHALCPNKRGVFLALLLERLEALNPRGFLRIGLSATQRPLEEVARYLGGNDGDKERPVTIVDAGLRKNLDLKVLSPVERFGPLPEKSVWPSIHRTLADHVLHHRSTIIFANSRRVVERITSQLQEVLDDVGAADDRTLAIRAHHGSVSLDVRRETERALKQGELQAVVATASLELGIDMGAVDLVCQVESTGNVARGLQRVGRAGHLVGQHSKGRLIAKTLPDLLDLGVLASEMAAGRVEELRVPVNCLDVLAQQIVAMVAMEPWDVGDLYKLVRRAYPYRGLTPRALDAVLEMISGRYKLTPEEGAATDADASPNVNKRGGALSALQPRVSWDRVHNRLEALPGTQRLALMNGGTIPDTGQFAVVTRKGLRIGEVDEEFVFERRVGEAFLLGTNAWRIDSIDTDRVIVEPAQGAPAMVPFWHGEMTGRTYDLAIAQGRFLRRLSDNLDAPDCLEWLEREHFLEPRAAKNVREYVLRQKLRAECVSSDRLIAVEASRDPLGDWQVVLLASFGSRVHLTLRFALENRLRQRLGYRPQCLHHDEGVLVRLTESDQPVLDLLEGITPENIESLVLDELADSALFALRFRQNAARALLTPRGQAGRRAPLWLQRLRGRDLLQVARRFPDFPIVAETFRECLHDHLDVPRAATLLADLREGKIALRTMRLDGPSPFAASLLFGFQMASMYQYDDVEAGGGDGYTRLDRQLLDHLVSGQDQALPLDPRAIDQVERRLRGVGMPPRSKAEMAEWLRRLGDLTPREVEGGMAAFLTELEDEGRAKRIVLPRVAEPERWVLVELEPAFQMAFGGEAAEAEARRQAGAEILGRFLETHALVGLRDVLARYPFEAAWAEEMLQAWARSGRVVAVARAEAPEPVQWSAPVNLQQVQRGTLAILRREVTPCPPAQFAHFVAQWQRADAASRAESIGEVLDLFGGLYLPADLWETAVLPARLGNYQTRDLDEAIESGQWLWTGLGAEERGPGLVSFLPREEMGSESLPALSEGSLAAVAERVQELLQSRGAMFVPDIAQETGLSPSAVRASLWGLVRLGLATNDRFDVVRRGEEKTVEAASEAPLSRQRGRGAASLLRPARVRPRATLVPEGRWSLIPWGHPNPELTAIRSARRLLVRHGIVAREVAALDPRMPPWRVLYEVLSRLELGGEVRRGYFVEGLSGAQFALPEAARRLQDLASPSQAGAMPTLLHSLDPANLYGSGAPFDQPLLDDGARLFSRRPGNWIVLRAGKPVLLIEQHGVRLTAPPGSHGDDLAAAVGLMPAIVSRSRTRDPRRKLTVETWNGGPVTAGPGKELLEAAGFVRDYQSMTWYSRP